MKEISVIIDGKKINVPEALPCYGLLPTTA